jgi:hypothetical protein
VSIAPQETCACAAAGLRKAREARPFARILGVWIPPEPIAITEVLEQAAMVLLPERDHMAELVVVVAALSHLRAVLGGEPIDLYGIPEVEVLAALDRGASVPGAAPPSQRPARPPTTPAGGQDSTPLGK